MVCFLWLSSNSTPCDSMPGLRSRLPDLPAVEAGDPEQARFRLFDGIASFLRGVAADEPLLLVLDDLHWADASSLRLVEFLSHEIERILLVVGPLLGVRDDVSSRRKPTRTLEGP